MTSHTTKPDSLQPATELAVDLFDNWFDPIETEVRARSRQFIEELIRGELDAALARPRYGRSRMAGNEAGASVAGHRHGSRTRSLTGTFGPIEIAVPRARLTKPEGKTAEWRSQALRAYQRRTLAADALIASSYLAGTNTRRVRRALAALFGGTVGKDTVSRTWRKVKGDWDAWNSRSLAEEPIVRLILDGTVVRVRLDRKATPPHQSGSYSRSQPARDRYRLLLRPSGRSRNRRAAHRRVGENSDPQALRLRSYPRHSGSLPNE
jgi:putative transposase